MAVSSRLRLRHLLVVQLGRALEPQWDLHMGNRLKAKTTVSDCLHHCYAPLLYQPLWWALRHAAASTTGSSLTTASRRGLVV